MGQKVTESTTVDAPVAAVWGVITDLEAYPEWAEGVLEVEVLQRDEEGRPGRARFRIDAKVTEVTYTLRYSYEGDDVRWTLVEGETVTQLDGSYLLEERDDDCTHVRYSLEADVDIPFPSFLKKRAAKQILEQGLRGLRERVEASA